MFYQDFAQSCGTVGLMAPALSLSHSLNNSKNSETSATSASLSPLSKAPSKRSNLQTAYAAATALPVILENGRKVFGPPDNYTGPRPTYLSELYITRMPEHIDELGFLVWLHCCGTVYQFRLMMDSCSSTRGYAFVRFTQESEALAAYELLNFLFVNGDRVSVFRSQGKNRLYISSIPKEMPLSALEEGFRKAFPEMESCTAYPAKDSYALEKNRGYAFIEFYDHEQALEAKKRTTPGRVRMWGCDLKVQWAKPKTDITNFVEDEMEHTSFQMISRFQNYAAKLRLYCLANNWCIPIVLYGSSFRQCGVQYCGILLKNPVNGVCSIVVMEISVDHVYDVHILMSEVVVLLIEQEHGIPKTNYILRVSNGNKAEILYTHTVLVPFDQLHLKVGKQLLSTCAVYTLMQSLQVLAQYSSEAILRCYKKSFLASAGELPTMTLNSNNSSGYTIEPSVAQYYAILPKYRNNKPLNNNFNDTEIVLLQANNYSNSTHHINTSFRNIRMTNWYHHLPSSTKDTQKYNYVPGTQCQASHGLRLKSQRFSNFNNNYELTYVEVENLSHRGFYHPAQRINSHPIWILGDTYQNSTFQIS